MQECTQICAKGRQVMDSEAASFTEPAEKEDQNYASHLKNIVMNSLLLLAIIRCFKFKFSMCSFMLIVDALTQQVCVFIGGLHKSGRKNGKKNLSPCI